MGYCRRFLKLSYPKIISGHIGDVARIAPKKLPS
jgi:hypothetical protein